MDGVVLFADNNVFSGGNENQLFNLFLQKKEFTVLPIDTLACLEATIKSASTFKACIIDWNFTDSGDFSSDFNDDFAGVDRPDRTPLTILSNYTLYSLVYIYSGKEIPETDKNLLQEKYGTKIRFRTKTNSVEKEYNAISEDIRNFETDNPHMNIPCIWSQAINKSAQTIFNELENADPCWIKEIRDTALNDGGDATSEIIDIFNNLLNEDLIQNKQLRDCLEAYNSAEKINKEENTAKLYRRIYYSVVTDEAPLMTGDIFKFDEDNYGIIITPECELTDKKKEEKKSFYDFLIINKKMSKEYQQKQQNNFIKNSHSSKDIFNNGALNYHVLISFPFESNIYNYIGLIDFNTAFRTLPKKEDKNISILDHRTRFKLNAPYIHQLRQRFVAYLGKYGVPSIPDSLRTYNLKKVE